MTDYTELVKALRHYNGPSYKMTREAAAAIEALIADVEKKESRITGLGNRIFALEQQLPKRGEWIEENRRPRSSQFVCSECHRTAYDPQPTRDKAWRKRCRYAYCPNCGAKMNNSNASNASNALNALDNAQDGPIITPCRGCSDYDGYGGCKSKGGCAKAKMEVQE